MRLKFFSAFLWAIGILLVMNTSNAEAFLYDQVLRYELNLNPDFFELFRYSDVTLTDAFYLIQKSGHIFSFGILYVLVFNWLNTHFKALWICIVFAISSEIIQLFFQRNGRLFDVGVDLIGIFLAYKLTGKISANKAKANQT